MIMKDEMLTEAEIKLLQRNGIFTDMSVEDVQEDEIEAGMWLRVRDEKPNDLLAFADLVADYSGWDRRSAQDYARSSWKAAKKLIALAGK